MKVQSLAVIFAIIILPIVIIITYFINYEIKTIEQQNKYDTMLIDSTYDAMAAFELNTANEDLSGVADSLRSIIDASTNVFFNTLATNLGISNANIDHVRTYIPAILYTLYDGYYIYSPTRVPTVLTTMYDPDGDGLNLEEKIVYVGDGGVSIADSTSVPIKYRFNASSYSPGANEAIYASLPASRKFEYGQMLYANDEPEGTETTYSTQLNDHTKYTQDYILKSYMPYSVRYLENPVSPDTSNYDITINYTLDNYLSVEGEIGDVYYSKTGYLIAKDTVSSVAVDGASDVLNYNEDTIEQLLLSGEHSATITITPYVEDGINRTAPITISFNPYVDPDSGVVLSANAMQEKINKILEDLENLDKNAAKEADPANRMALEADANNLRTQLQDLEVNISNLKAITYYLKAQIFSNWVYATLGNESGGLSIRANNIATDIAGLNAGIYTSANTDDITAIFHDFAGDSTIIFDSAENPEKEDSPFYSHKLYVIKNSIQYNLNLALSSYNMMADRIDIQMPVMTQDEWDKILNNVSITTFMQGLNCGLKQYNDYAIVCSTNNELTVIPDEIYYVEKNQFNNPNSTAYYHRIDCDELPNTGDYISFTSKEIKYDKLYDRNSQFYRYDHRNNGCYTCIVNNNYEKVIDSAGNRGYSDSVVISALTPEKQRAYFIAVGKERQNLYKTNALTSSNGYETLYMSPTATPLQMTFGGAQSLSLSKQSSLGMKAVKELEITIANVATLDPGAASTVATATLEIQLGGASLGEYTINVGQATPQTIVVPVHINSDVTISSGSIVVNRTSPDDIKLAVLGVRAIYE